MKIGPRPDQQPVPGTTSTGAAAGGDVGGTLPGGTIVQGIGGSPIVGTPIAGDHFEFDGSDWVFVPAATPSGPAGGDLSGTYPNPSVVDDSHAHTAATLPVPTGVGPLLISDTHSTPLVFADLLQNEAGSDLLYADI